MPFQKGNTIRRGTTLSKEHKKRISDSCKGNFAGKKHPNWKGGKYKRKDGYIYVFTPGHPDSPPRGYIMEHRLVMEKKLGRRLKQKEVVHHINGIKDDNRKSNLRLFPNINAHSAYHKKLKRHMPSVSYKQCS
jgi:hypothetical protein